MAAPKHIRTLVRPYGLLFFGRDGSTHPLSSEEAQRLIDSALADGESLKVTRASRARVDFESADGTRSMLYATTLGGGPAFEFES